jgi:transcriptional regulator with XRE-family HTH domain
MYFIGKGDINQASNLIFSMSYLQLGISNLIILLSNLIIFKKGNKKMSEKPLLFNAEDFAEDDVSSIAFAAPFIEIFYNRMIEKGYTFAELAARSGESKQTVVRFFKASSKNPSAETTKNIARALDISLDEVFGLRKPEQKLDPNIEAIINAHADIIKERDARIKELSDRLIERDETIKQLRVDKVKMQEEKSKVTTFTFALGAFILIFLLFDLMNGHFGFFRY